MAPMIDRPRDALEEAAGYEVQSRRGADDPVWAKMFLKWRKFLTGPRLQPGRAIAIIALIALLFWLGVFALIRIL